MASLDKNEEPPSDNTLLVSDELKSVPPQYSLKTNSVSRSSIVSSRSSSETLRTTDSSSTTARKSSRNAEASPKSMHQTKLEYTPKAGPWRASPHKLRRTHCSCTAHLPHDPPRASPSPSPSLSPTSPTPALSLPAASDLLQLSLRHLYKLWSRLLHSVIPPELRAAGERATLRLRREGWETVHLVGRELGRDETGGKRRAVSVVFLVPDAAGRGRVSSDADAEGDGVKEGVGHRWVAELLVHIHPHSGDIQTIAVRFSSDWEDWHISQPWQYQRMDGAAPPVGLRLQGKREGVHWDSVVEQLGMVVQAVGGCVLPKAEFGRWVWRVVEELKVEGERVCGFDVEKVYREESGEKSGKRRRYCPVVRVAMDVMREGVKSEAVGAVMLLEVGDMGGKVKSLAVLYEGEWPVYHHYKTAIPPPTLDGLEAIVKQRKSKSTTHA